MKDINEEIKKYDNGIQVILTNDKNTKVFPGFKKIEEIIKKEKEIKSGTSTAKFLFEHSDNDYMSQLIKTNFENFINGNLGNYDELKNKKIRVVGDFAYRFKEILQKAMNEKKIEVDKIIESAMDGLQEYHINHPIYWL